MAEKQTAKKVWMDGQMAFQLYISDEILVKYVSKSLIFHLKIYYMKISNMNKNQSTVLRMLLLNNTNLPIPHYLIFLQWL